MHSFFSRWLHSRYRRAFTLIELLVVIVILGILMAVAVPTFLRQQTKAQDSRTQQYLTTAYKAIRASTPETNNAYPAVASLVSWIKQSEPELNSKSGDCLTTVTDQTATPVDQILVDPASSANALTLCARSQSGNVWKLTASATGAPTLADGTLVALTLSGNEVTDAKRAASVQGDGLAADSSTGIWEATTNYVLDGGFESPLSDWGSLATGASVVRDPAVGKFGVASLHVTADGTSANQGALYTGSTLPGAANQTYSASAWVKGSGSVQIFIEEWDGAAWGGQTVSSARTLTGAWQRITVTRTMSASATSAKVKILTSGTLVASFWLDGVQYEQQPIATPYVETSGATAGRGWSLVQTPAPLLNATQGWIAMRVRMDWAPSARSGMGSNPPRFWTWGTSYQDFQLYAATSYDGKLSFYRDSGRPGGGGVVSTAPAWNTAGDYATVVASWTASQVALSVNGSAFVTAANSGIPPSLPATSQIGSMAASTYLDSDVLWFSCGVGALSDADAATINSWGSNDPARSSFPAGAQATMVWDGASANGSLK